LKRRYAILEAPSALGHVPEHLGGLTWDDGIAILRTSLASSRAAGLQVAIYNPEIDKDGSNGRGLAVAVRSALA
jgi:arginase family enzyme